MIYYHEDNYRQIEFVPEENYFTVNKVVDELPVSTGFIYGIDSITSRAEQKTKLETRKITFDAIDKILSPLALFYSNDVSTGYGQTKQKAKNTFVWGFEQYGIFIKLQDGFVTAIWVSDSAVFPQLKTSKHLAEAILAICKLYSLILIDWNKEIICRVKHQNDIREYLFQNFSFDYY